MILDALSHALSPRSIVDRTSPRAAKAEGFDAAERRGARRRYSDSPRVQRTWARVPDPARARTEDRFLPRSASAARKRRGFWRVDRRVLDAFTYVGALALAAARGGAAEVTAVDTSALALETRPLAPSSTTSRSASASNAPTPTRCSPMPGARAATTWWCATRPSSRRLALRSAGPWTACAGLPPRAAAPPHRAACSCSARAARRSASMTSPAPPRSVRATSAARATVLERLVSGS